MPLCSAVPVAGTVVVVGVVEVLEVTGVTPLSSTDFSLSLLEVSKAVRAM
jgi:hypothetical protein